MAKERLHRYILMFVSGTDEYKNIQCRYDYFDGISDTPQQIQQSSRQTVFVGTYPKSSAGNPMKVVIELGDLTLNDQDLMNNYNYVYDSTDKRGYFIEEHSYINGINTKITMVMDVFSMINFKNIYFIPTKTNLPIDVDNKHTRYAQKLTDTNYNVYSDFDVQADVWTDRYKLNGGKIFNTYNVNYGDSQPGTYVFRIKQTRTNTVNFGDNTGGESLLNQISKLDTTVQAPQGAYVDTVQTVGHRQITDISNPVDQIRTPSMPGKLFYSQSLSAIQQMFRDYVEVANSVIELFWTPFSVVQNKDNPSPSDYYKVNTKTLPDVGGNLGSVDTRVYAFNGLETMSNSYSETFKVDTYAKMKEIIRVGYEDQTVDINVSDYVTSMMGTLTVSLEPKVSLSKSSDSIVAVYVYYSANANKDSRQLVDTIKVPNVDISLINRPYNESIQNSLYSDIKSNKFGIIFGMVSGNSEGVANTILEFLGTIVDVLSNIMGGAKNLFFDIPMKATFLDAQNAMATGGEVGDHTRYDTGYFYMQHKTVSERQKQTIYLDTYFNAHDFKGNPIDDNPYKMIGMITVHDFLASMTYYRSSIYKLTDQPKIPFHVQGNLCKITQEIPAMIQVKLNEVFDKGFLIELA